MSIKLEGKHGITAKIVQDQDACNPITEFEGLGRLETAHRRYAFGNATIDADRLGELIDDINHGKIWGLYVWMYDHSGVTLKTTRTLHLTNTNTQTQTLNNPFTCRWDSGLLGVIWCEPDAWGYSEEKCLQIMEDEIKTLNDYLTGNVWGFRIYDADGWEIDAIGGYYGDPEESGVIAEAKSVMADYAIKESLERIEQYQWECRS